MQKKTRPIRTALKILYGLFQLLMIYAFFTLIIQIALEIIDLDNEEYHLHHYDELIAEDNYGDLHDELILFDDLGEEYDDYWKVVDAYQLYCRYSAASKAAQNSDDPVFTEKCKRQEKETYEALFTYPEDADNLTAQAAIRRIKEKL